MGSIDVFYRVEIGNQVARALLPHETDLLAAVLVELAVGHAQQVVAVHAHAAGRRPVKPAQNVHERRLAAAGGADDRHQLTFFDGDVELAQRHLFQPGDFVDLDEPVTQDKRFFGQTELL